MTTRTVLIVGGAAVGVVVLFKLLSPTAPTPRVATKQKGLTDLISLNSIIGAASSIFGGGGGPANLSDQGGAYSDAASQAAISQVAGSSSVNISDNFIYTTPDGGFIAG